MGIRAALRSDRGASAVEYGLLVVAIAAVIVAVVFTLGTLTKGHISTACNQWGSSAGNGSC